MRTGRRTASCSAAPDAVLKSRTPCAPAPEGLVGIAWFGCRPTPIPRLEPADMAAVIAGELPAARLSAGLVPAERADLWTVTLSNDGPVDAALRTSGPTRSRV